MLETESRYVLQDLPLVIDPVALGLEVRTVRRRAPLDDGAEAGPEVRWVQLQRVQVQHDTFPFALNSRMVHFFGPSSRAEACPFLLAYDATGLLRYRIVREDEFVAEEVPEELNGKAVRRPSVRLTFDSADEAELFMAAVEAARSGSGGPDVGPLLRRAEARHTTVARKP